MKIILVAIATWACCHVIYVSAAQIVHSMEARPKVECGQQAKPVESKWS